MKLLVQRARPLVQTGLMFLAGWFVYSPALRGDWLWDDLQEIPLNLTLRDRAGLAQIWFAQSGPDYFPITSSLQWLQWHLWGEARLGYHLTNLGLHLLGGFLLWRLLRKLGLRFAFFGGLLFVVHPLTVESVAWISELKNTLSLVFLLLAFSAYLEWDRKRGMGFQPMSDENTGRMPVPRQFRSIESSAGALLRKDEGGDLKPEIRSKPGGSDGSKIYSGFRSHLSSFRYLLSLACFLAAMLSKSSVVMFPVVLLLYAWWRRPVFAPPCHGAAQRSRMNAGLRRGENPPGPAARAGEFSGRRDLLATVPFFALALLLGGVTFWFQIHRAIGGWHLDQGNFWSRAAAAGRAIAFYLGKFIWPVGLLPIYPRWPPPTLLQFTPWALLGLALACLWGKRAAWGRHALFGLGFFLVNLIPILGFAPMSFLHIAPVADHFVYLPMVGLVGLTAAGLGAKWPIAGRRWPVFRLIAAGAICLLLAIESRQYARMFADQETLWTYTLARNPRSPAVHVNFAFILRHDGRMAEAIAQYEEALRLSPADAYLESDFAGALVAAGRRREGIDHYRRAVALDADLVDARTKLGDSLAEDGQRSEAVANYREALHLNPQLPDVENSLGVALVDGGELPEAITHYQAALRLKPDFAEAENNLGLALATQRHWNEAIAHLKSALGLKPDFAKAHDNLGFALGGSGRLQEAEAEFERATDLAPDVVEYQNNLGSALARIGRTQAAIACFRRALRLEPEDASAHYNLGVMLQTAGLAQEAALHFGEALRIRPDFTAARERLMQVTAGK